MSVNSRRALAVLVALGVGAMIAQGYSEFASTKGHIWFVLWLSHAACLFFPFVSYLGLEERISVMRGEQHQAALKRGEGRPK